MISRVLKETIGRKQNDSSRALIIGAGSGTLLVRQLTQKNDLGIMPVAFIDDDQTKHKLEIMCPSSAEKKALCRRCRG